MGKAGTTSKAWIEYALLATVIIIILAALLGR
jgi:hypothetical protein